MIIRGFHHSSRAWYKSTLIRDNEREGIVDSMSLGFYDTEGGTTGEFEVHWVNLAGKLTFRLKAYSDSMKALAGFSDVLVTTECGMSPEDFVSHLKKCNIEDLTAYAREKHNVSN